MKKTIIFIIFAAICAALLTSCCSKRSEAQIEAETILRTELHPGSPIEVLSFDFVGYDNIEDQLKERIVFYQKTCTEIEPLINEERALYNAAQQSKNKTLIDMTGDRMNARMKEYDAAYLKLGEAVEILEKYKREITENVKQELPDLSNNEWASYYLLRYRIKDKPVSTMLCRFRETALKEEYIIAYKDMFKDWFYEGNWYQIPGYTDNPPCVK